MNLPPLTPAEILQFDKAFSQIQELAHQINRDNGWWEDRELLVSVAGAVSPELASTAAVQVIIACLGLAATEIAEAIEAVRKHDPKTWGDETKKDTLVRELAGTIVRCMDLAQMLQHGDKPLPLGRAILEELVENSKRGFRHGGKRA